MNLPNLSIHSIHQAYREGEYTVRSLVEELYCKADNCGNPGIWIRRLSLEELDFYLRKLESKSMEDLPLYGIPFVIKDNIDLENIATTAACPDFSYMPEGSATVVELFIQAGAIPMGKTNLDQFATGLVGVRTPYGVPLNPLAPDRIPGGSSAGSAVALSQGLATFSLGTDTAGSGRVPAAFNQIIGVKPSRGRLSNKGVVPACRSLDCVSIFALDFSDAKKVLSIAEGYDPKEPYSIKSFPISQKNCKKLAIPRKDQLLFFGDAEFQDAWFKTVKELMAKGWFCSEVDFTPFIECTKLLYEGPWIAERCSALQHFLKEKSGCVFPTTRKILETGFDKTAVDTFDAMYRLTTLRRQIEPILEKHQALVVPTVGGFPTLQEIDEEPIKINSDLGYYTNFVNLFDLCALATPAGKSSKNLPFGITWITARGYDYDLIRIAQDGSTKQGEPYDRISLVLFGAHLSGLPLNYQVKNLDGQFVAEVETSPDYRMLLLKNNPPIRPGVYRSKSGGVSIRGEEWSFPTDKVGSFLKTIQKPLGLGQVQLDDGRCLHGFLCEAVEEAFSEEITKYRGWKNFLKLNLESTA